MYETLRNYTAPLVSKLTVEGLRGRILTHPNRKESKGRTILFVYGIHGSLERFYGVIHYLANFGTMYVPDLPGFGGMESFYKVGRKPSLDEYGDYLADVIDKSLPKDEPLTLIGLSYGFVVITRMLSRHPQLQGRVDLLISAMGLTDGRDINMGFPIRPAVETILLIGRTPYLGKVLQGIITNPITLRLTYTDHNPKMKVLPKSERPGYIAFESYLWKCNDMRTYAVAMHELLNYRQPETHIPITLHHIQTKSDHWLDITLVAEHLDQIYPRVVLHESKIESHGGVAYASETEAKSIIPASIVKLLEQPS